MGSLSVDSPGIMSQMQHEEVTLTRFVTVELLKLYPILSKLNLLFIL